MKAFYKIKSWRRLHFDLHISKNLRSEKQKRERAYVGNGNTTLSCYNTGWYVPWEYSCFNLNAMGA